MFTPFALPLCYNTSTKQPRRWGIQGTLAFGLALNPLVNGLIWAVDGYNSAQILSGAWPPPYAYLMFLQRGCSYVIGTAAALALSSQQGCPGTSPVHTTAKFILNVFGVHAATSTPQQPGSTTAAAAAADSGVPLPEVATALNGIRKVQSLQQLQPKQDSEQQLPQKRGSHQHQQQVERQQGAALQGSIGGLNDPAQTSDIEAPPAVLATTAVVSGSEPGVAQQRSVSADCPSEHSMTVVPSRRVEKQQQHAESEHEGALSPHRVNHDRSHGSNHSSDVSSKITRHLRVGCGVVSLTHMLDALAVLGMLAFSFTGTGQSRWVYANALRLNMFLTLFGNPMYACCTARVLLATLQGRLALLNAALAGHVLASVAAVSYSMYLLQFNALQLLPSDTELGVDNMYTAVAVLLLGSVLAAAITWVQGVVAFVLVERPFPLLLAGRK